ncbi:Uncharacterized protein QTN25_009135 [Entamoeba marina]
MSDCSSSDENKEDYQLNATILNGRFLQNQTNTYCSCRINQIKYRTKTLIGSSPTWDCHWEIKIPAGQRQLIINVCRHGVLNKKIILGTVTIALYRLGVNLATTEIYSIINDGVKIGYLKITFQRLNIDTSLPSKTKRRTLSITPLTKSITIKHRKKYLPSPSAPVKGSLIESTGLFSAVFTMTTGDIAEDLKHYIQHEGDVVDIEGVGLTGYVTACYPPNINGDVIPTNIWNFCFIDGLKLQRTPSSAEVIPFVMTDASGNTRYASFLTTYYLLPEQTIKEIRRLVPNAPRTLYTPFAVGVTSKFPLHSLMRKWLSSLYLSNITSNRIFTDLCHEVIFKTGTPSYGVPFSANFSSLNFSVDIELPLISGLSPLPTSCLPLLRMVGVDGVLSIWLALLQGDKVVVMSRSRTALVYAIEIFKSLLFPFEWCNICINTLPYTLLDYLASPMTFFMGVPAEYETEAAHVLRNEDVVFLNLDEGIVLSNSIIRVVPDIIKNVRKEICDLLLNSKGSNDDPFTDAFYASKHDIFDSPLRIILFKCIGTLLASYRDYVGYTWIADSATVKTISFSTFESQHFQFFLQNFPNRHDHVFDDWQINNIYLHDTQTLIEKYKDIPSIVTIHQTSTVKNTSTSPLNKLCIDATKLNSLRVRNAIVRASTQPINYHNHLHDSKLPPLQHKMDNNLIQFCDIQIGILALMNEGTTTTLDTDLMFNFLSEIDGRLLFHQRLLSKANCFKVEGKQNVVTNEVYCVLADIIRQAATYAFSQKDMFSPQSMIQCALTFKKISDNQTITLLPALKGLEIWDKMDIWFNAFSKVMKSDKQEVYGEQYGLDLPNRWNDFDPPQQRKYKSLEEEKVRVSEKTIKQFVGCALSRLRIDESIRTEIGKTVYDICQINSSSIDTKDFEPGTLLMKVYDEMYTK